MSGFQEIMPPHTECLLFAMYYPKLFTILSHIILIIFEIFSHFVNEKTRAPKVSCQRIHR